MSLTSLEKRESTKLECSYSLGTDEKENIAYSLGTKGVYVLIIWICIAI